MTDNQLVLLLLAPTILGFAGYFLREGAISKPVFGLVALGTISAGTFLFLTQ